MRKIRIEVSDKVGIAKLVARLIPLAVTKE